MIGLDTGFFVELMNGNEMAVNLWSVGIDDEVEFVVSALTLFEVERLGLRGTLSEADAVLDAINGVTQVVWLDHDILSQAARLSRGLGIPAMDSLILASLVSNGCTEIYTTDSHLGAYRSKKVSVRNLRKSE
jgi:predicted nucleic acid-binding protein